MGLHHPVACIEQSGHETQLRVRRLPNLFLVAPFMLIFLAQLSRHEMWRDELNAWGIAVASPTLNSLFAKLHYEGHPAFWYVLLWCISRFTANPIAMKFLEAAIGTGAYLLIDSFSPFSIAEKIFLFFGYFVSFEYTVLSRTYSICFLVLLIYLYLRCKYPRHLLLNAVLLGLMANCDVMGIILSATLFTEYVWYQLAQPKRHREALHRHLLFAGLTYAALVALALSTLRLAPDISWRTTGHMFAGRCNLPRFFLAALNFLVVVWLPIGSGFPHHFWNGTPGEHLGLHTALLPLVLMGLFLVFRRTPRMLATLGAAACGALVFGALIYMGGVRQFGVTFMAFLAALWIQRSEQTCLSLLRYVFLGAGAVAGLQAGIAHWDHPFSNAGATARWLRRTHLDQAVLVGSPDTSVAAVAEQLNRPIYFLDCSCTDTFLSFANRRDSFRSEQIPDRLATAAQRFSPSDMVLILARQLTSGQIAALADKSLFPVLVAQFTGAEVPEEDFFVYRFQPQK